MLQSLQAISPALLLIGLASLMYLAGAFVAWPPRWWLGIGLAGIGLALVTEYSCAVNAVPRESALVSSDPLARFGTVLALLSGLGLLLLTGRVPERETAAEYVASLLLIVAGGSLVASAQELVLLFLGLELISIPSYVVLYLARHDPCGQEATAKYFFLSIFSSALFLYGLSFVYGTVGTTHLEALRQLGPAPAAAATMTLALTLVLAGLGFKMAAVPFHFYAPDVYQGTSPAAAAVLAWAPKAAGVVALLKLVVFALPAAAAQGAWLVWLLAALTMTVGNVLGLLQDHLRRLLAYSSIAHAGYMLVGVGAACAGGSEFLTSGAPASVMFYLAVYAAMTLGAFAVLAYLASPERPVETIDDLAGLARTQPVVAAAMAALLIGLTGIPLTAGFWGKLAVFADAITCRDPRYLWLAVIGVLNAAISAYYYLRIIGAMYFRHSQRPVQPAGGRGPLCVALLGALLTVLVGVWPGPLLHAVRGISGQPPVAVAAEHAPPAMARTASATEP